MNLARGLALALTLVACGGKKEDKPDKASGSAAASGSAVKLVTAEDLFPGTKVALPAPAAKEKFGMTLADIKTVAPEIWAEKYGYAVPGSEVKYKSVKIVNDYATDDGRLYSVRLELIESKESAVAWMTKKWGAPLPFQDGTRANLVWNNPADHLRVKLEDMGGSPILYFSQMQARDALLGTDPKKLAFDSPSLIGQSLAAAQKQLLPFGDRPAKVRTDDDGSYTFGFLPTENEMSSGSSLGLRVKADKVTGYTLGFGSNEADRKALEDRLVSMYGAGKPEEGMDIYTVYPSKAPTVKAELRKDAGYSDTVWVGDYRK